MESVKHLKDDCDLEYAKNKKLPSNSYLVEYMKDGTLTYDVVMSSKKVEIFDQYWDKFRGDLKNITQTSGTVNPKIFNGLEDE